MKIKVRETATIGQGFGKIISKPIEIDGTLNFASNELNIENNLHVHKNGVLQLYGNSKLKCTANLINEGCIYAKFNADNSLPSINVDGITQLRFGIIGVRYTGEYISGGFYPIITASKMFSVHDLGRFSVPQADAYITDWKFTIVDNIIGVNVTRLGFADVATVPMARRIGAELDALGKGILWQAEC